MEDAELQSLIDELDELSTQLWMNGSIGSTNVAGKLDNIITKYRSEDFIGD